MIDFSDDQIDRYARHLVLPEVGEEGQARLLDSRVLVIGAGGLGSPLLLYLAAAGVGTIGVVDDDEVDLSNLQRQVVHDSSKVGTPKVESAVARLREVNPEVRVVPHATRVRRDNVEALIADYELVADGSDNFPTRYLLNDACHFAGKTLVSAAIMRFDGQISTYKTHRRAEEPEGHPCYRCLFGPQPPQMKDSCADVGVLGALAGTLGSMQATEVVKELLQIGESLSGRLMLYDALEASVRVIQAKPDPGCALCGEAPSILSLDSLPYDEDSAVCAA